MLYVSASRVVRSFGILFALLAAALFAASKVLATYAPMATGLVAKAVARYSSTTGKLALENFAEDKLLYAEVLKLKATLLPLLSFADSLLPKLAVACVVLAVICLVVPRQVAQVLVALKLWKGRSFEETVFEKSAEAAPAPVKKLPAKVIVPAVVVVLALAAALTFLKAGGQVSREEAASELSKTSAEFVKAVKAGFNKSKKIVAPAAPDSGIFVYSVSKAGNYTATLATEVEGCPAGSAWKIQPKTEGFFTQTLKIARIAPRDTNCAKIYPDFKNVGR